MIIKNDSLEYTLVRKDELTASNVARMFEMMTANYTHVTEHMFLSDLNNKQFIGLIYDEEGSIQGFTTFVINPGNCAGSEYHIIFSGDTIIDPLHWGTQILMKGWCHTIGRLTASDKNLKWYWYLLTKGHRTYMYLPLFFKIFYPNPDRTEDQEELSGIADSVSSTLYGVNWKKELGVLKFSEHHGELNPELTEATFKKTKSPYVNFFRERNPEFYKGDELVCIAPLHHENLIRTAKEYFLLGMDQPLSPKK